MRERVSERCERFSEWLNANISIPEVPIHCEVVSACACRKANWSHIWSHIHQSLYQNNLNPQIVPLEPLLTYPKTSTLVRSKSKQTTKGKVVLIVCVSMPIPVLEISKYQTKIHLPFSCSSTTTNSKSYKFPNNEVK